MGFQHINSITCCFPSGSDWDFDEQKICRGWMDFFFTQSRGVSLKKPARNCFFSGIIFDIQGVKSDETVNPKNVRSPNFSQRS